MAEMNPLPSLRRAIAQPGEPGVENHRLELPPELLQNIVINLRCRKNAIL